MADINDLLAQLLIGIGKTFPGGVPGKGVEAGGKVAERTQGLQVSPVRVGSAITKQALGSPTAFANQVVAEEAQKTVRKAVKGQVENLISQGVDPTKILETTEGFGVRQQDQKKSGTKQESAQPLNQKTESPKSQDTNGLLQALGQSIKNIIGEGFEGGAQALGVKTGKGRQRDIEDQLQLERRRAEEIPLAKARREELGIKSGLEIQKLAIKEASNLQKKGQLSGDKLFEKFEQASKPFIEIRDGFARLQNAVTNQRTGELDFTGTNPASDLDLLFGTAKTLDPSGRVTDSDIAIQQAATGAYGDGVKKIVQKFQRRGFMAPNERKALFNAAAARFKSAETQQQRTVKEFSRLAEKQGFSAQNLFRDVGLANRGGSLAQSQKGTTVLTTSSGNKFKRVS